jgi:sigma-B regulation protein RsbU (phosphoserine phosphatase)
MDGAIKMIDTRVSKVETAVNTAAGYAYLLAQDKKKAYTLLQRLIAANDDIAAGTLMYRAGYFPDEGRYYAPTISRDPVSGALEEDEIGGPEYDFCYLETDSNWVYTTKLDTGYWCLPYVDSMSTKRAMVTYSVPLHDERGETYAILCADVDLQWVRHVVETSKPYEYSTVMVLSRDSQYVCHPDSQYVLSINAITQVKHDNETDIIRLTENMLRWKRGVDTVHSMVSFDSPKAKEHYDTYIVFYAPVERVQWSLCFSIPQEKVMELPNRLGAHMRILIIVLLVTIAFMLRYIIRHQLLPLKDLATSASKVAQGDFHATLPEIRTEDEIRNLRDSFENMQLSLTEYMDRLQKTTASKAMIESELQVAKGIQMSMLPRIPDAQSPTPDTQLYGCLTPAKAVGGDLFDFFVRDGKLFFCIGDVSGKGVPAALVMAVTQAQFRTISAHEDAPERIITELNDRLAADNTTNMFVTLFVGIFDPAEGVLRYSNAGHDSPLLITSGGTDFLSCDSNLPCGVMPGWQFTQQQAVIASGTTVLLYTDGLTEAENIDHAQFGEDRIVAVAQQSDALPRPLIDLMTAAVHDFVGEAEQSDDLTMLAIRYK